MAPVGRWQKGKDLSWYARDKKDGTPLTREEELAALGLGGVRSEPFMLRLAGVCD